VRMAGALAGEGVGGEGLETVAVGNRRRRHYIMHLYQTAYIKLRIYRMFLNGPLDFDITRFNCSISWCGPKGNSAVWLRSKGRFGSFNL